MEIDSISRNDMKSEDLNAFTEKDEEELQLEKLVFGDTAGFEAGLQRFAEEDEADLADVDEDDADDDGDDLAQVQDDNLFFVDDAGENEINDERMSGDEDESEEESDREVLDIYGGRAAWIDSDDEKVQISLVSSDKLKKLRKNLTDTEVSGKQYRQRLRERFERIYPVPQWARDDQKLQKKRLDREEDSDDEGNEDAMSDDEDELTSNNPLAEILQKSTTFAKSNNASSLLPPSKLDILRLVDANFASKSLSRVESLAFHPHHPLLLTAGYDRILRIFHIDGKKNPLASSLKIKSSTFRTAQFHPDGKRIFAAGRRKYLYIWNIETGNVDKITRMYGHEQSQSSMARFKISTGDGRYLALIGDNGWVNVLSAHTGQWIGGAKVENNVSDIAWHPDGHTLSIVNDTGDIWNWNADTRMFENRWRDEGGVGTTSIALSPNGRWCAVGSFSGMVSIFDLQHGVKRNSQEEGLEIWTPHKVLPHITTPVTSLEFSPDSQILAMGSREKRDEFRMIHVPSFTVFRNWPTSGTPLARVTSVAFSSGCLMMSVGNDGGHARLFRLNHYG